MSLHMETVSSLHNFNVKPGRFHKSSSKNHNAGNQVTSLFTFSMVAVEFSAGLRVVVCGVYETVAGEMKDIPVLDVFA